ncbi:amidohydrolase family protein [Streptomyces olivaceoviridis]|uniref:amidohydrolase family protein n=1 Tax=Streptomyces olivaceoviridis TaxID=1921 RepID=UPI0036AB94C6
MVRPLCAAHRARSDRGERGGAVTPGSMAPHASQYTVDELRTMVEDAHRRGLRVAAHAHGNRAVLDAVEAGVDTLEHVSFLNTRGLRSPRRGADRDRRWHGVRQWDTGCRPEGIGGAADGHRRAARPYPRGLRSAARARRPPGGGGSDAGIAPFEPHDVLPHPVAELRGPGLSAGRRCPPSARRRPGHPDSATGRDGSAPATTPTSSRRRVIRRLTPLPT